MSAGDFWTVIFDGVDDDEDCESAAFVIGVVGAEMIGKWAIVCGEDEMFCPSDDLGARRFFFLRGGVEAGDERVRFGRGVDTGGTVLWIIGVFGREKVLYCLGAVLNDDGSRNDEMSLTSKPGTSRFSSFMRRLGVERGVI